MASKRDSLTKPFLILGLLFSLASIAILLGIYLPLIQHEIRYDLRQRLTNPEPVVIPINEDFAITINKIGANSPIVAQVDPFDSQKYQIALSRGVAHAKGTALPDQMGNIFLFSHSSADLLLATRYNSVFYLLDKLDAGDEVDIYYLGKKYTYSLTNKVIAKPEEISYLQGSENEQTLTLMTCWPPGTSLNRLIWQGILSRVQ